MDGSFRSFLRNAFHGRHFQIHQRQLVDGSGPFYEMPFMVVTFKSHQRQLVDGSDPFYEMPFMVVTFKSHQRQLVDGSGPFYIRDVHSILRA